MEQDDNPFVLTKQSVFMQRISDAVVKGAVRYLQGTIAVDKAGAFAAKMNARYQLGLTGMQAVRQRKQGYATAKLYFFYPHKGAKTLDWILLVTEGQFKDELMAMKEKWRDPIRLQQRIIFTQYVLVRIPNPYDGQVRWSWRYTRMSYEAICHAIVHHVTTGNDQRVEQLIEDLYRSPSFSGVREQVKTVCELMKETWKSTRASHEKMPEIPKVLGYVRRLKDKGILLKNLQKQQLKGEGW